MLAQVTRMSKVSGRTVESKGLFSNIPVKKCRPDHSPSDLYQFPGYIIKGKEGALTQTTDRHFGGEAGSGGI